MEIRQLEYFDILCEELHFTKAAERLGISQPNLSQQIRTLENELGTPLFDRIGKRIALTESGRLLQEHGKQILNKLQYVKDAIQEIGLVQRGHLRVGVLPSDLDNRITELILEFHREYPNIQLTVIGSIDILKQVLDNELDIGLSTIPEPRDDITTVNLHQENFMLIVCEHHPWANRQTVELEEALSIPLVHFPKGYLGRNIVDSFCSQQKLKPVIETSSVFSLLNLVVENVGGTILPRTTVDRFHYSKLRFISIMNPTPFRRIGIIYRSDRFLGGSAQIFIHKMKEHLAIKE